MNTMLKKIRAQKKPKHLIVIIVLVFIILAASRIWTAIVLRYQTDAAAVPVVATVKASAVPVQEQVMLPGTIKPWHGAPVYARVDGYLKQWLVDIGDKVKKGDLLAVIEAPELDAQLRQAEADLKVAIANNQLAQVTAQRWIHLLKTDSVSKQETDEKVDAARALAATVLATQANRDRLHDLVGFERITAPFSGTISDRQTDIGALINAGSSSTSARPLFRMVQHNPLRLYVKIPQTYSSRMQANMQVSLMFSEYPGLVFQGKLLQTAHAIDPKTRTLLAQFVVNNEKEQLLPGGYTQVTINMPSLPHAVYLPVNTLLFRAQGLQVATLNKNNDVVLKSITIALDFGSQVEIGSGIKPGEQVIINPTDSIYNGQHVRLTV
ncbi:MAG: efflux RND transporter periplasmic adaptor subunit [Legionellales bacterium]